MLIEYGCGLGPILLHYFLLKNLKLGPVEPTHMLSA